MKLRNLRYFLKEATKSLIKNRLMSVASIFTVASCVLILTIYYCIAQNIEYFLTQFENTMGLTVFLSGDLSADDVNRLYNVVNGMDEVKSVRYVNEEEALIRFAETLGDESDLYDALQNDNPLHRSFEIELHSNRAQKEVIAALEALGDEGIGKIRHTVEIVDLFISINNVARIVSGVFAVCLGLISVTIIMNTIKLTVNSRRSEIGIMKYVGATNWFIRWPFVIEGILIGLIGSAIPVALCVIGYNKTTEWVYSFPLIESLGEFISGAVLFSALAPVAVAVGMLIGSIGSVMSMRKYLQV